MTNDKKIRVIFGTWRNRLNLYIVQIHLFQHKLGRTIYIYTSVSTVQPIKCRLDAGKILVQSDNIGGTSTRILSLYLS